MYKNSEGYSDPTAGAAMSSMMREYRQSRKKVWQRQNEMKTRKTQRKHKAGVGCPVL